MEKENCGNNSSLDHGASNLNDKQLAIEKVVAASKIIYENALELKEMFSCGSTSKNNETQNLLDVKKEVNGEEAPVKIETEHPIVKEPIKRKSRAVRRQEYLKKMQKMVRKNGDPIIKKAKKRKCRTARRREWLEKIYCF